MLTELLWNHKFLSDVTGCRKTQVSDCTGSTVYIWDTEALKFILPDKIQNFFKYHTHDKKMVCVKYKIINTVENCNGNRVIVLGLTIFIIL